MRTRNCLVVLVNIIMLVIFSVYSASADVINSTVCSAGADYTTIQDAVDAANDGSDTYNITLCNDETFVENVSIYSNVDLTLTTGNAIIDGGGTGSVISITNVSTQNVTLDGLTITNGSATYGGGIYVYNSAPSITNCVIENNQGEGIYFYNSASSSITNCTIDDNTNGGLLATISTNNLIVFDSTFKNNGYGAYLNKSWSSRFTRCTFINNSGVGAGTSDSPYSQFINCLFAKNARAISIGQYSTSSKIINCTVSANTNDSSSVYYRNISAGGHSIINSIVWGNEAGIDNQSTLTVTHSAIHGGWTGEGNIEDDPLFSAPEDDDFSLRCASPAKDSGDDSLVYDPDLAGNDRTVGNTIDMGAYEYQSTASCPVPTDLYVGDSEVYSTIQGAIDAAKDDDTIWVDQGTYEENIDFKGKDIKVISEYSEYPGLTIIDGGGSGNVVTFDTYEGTGAELNGFTIMDGSLGISLANFAMPSITNCIITSNSDNGIYVDYAFGNITDSIISDNTGEGIETSHSDLTVANSVIEGNSSSGIYLKDYSHYSFFSHSTIENNSSSSGGGGLRIADSRSPALENCLIRNNTASNAGGGISFTGIQYSPTVAPYISGCTIDNNIANGGGGVYIWQGKSAQFINCLITNNESTGATGSAIHINQYSDHTSLINSTVSDNIGATSSIYYRDISGGGHLTLNSIVWGNDAGINTGGGVTVTYSDIQSGWTGTGNIDADPDFVNSAAGDYHLDSSSSCINAGTTVNVFTDLDGNVRPVGFAYDMGAYEYNEITSDYGIISGYVMDYTNNPISSANVTLREYQAQGIVLGTTTSNSDGYYEFNSLSNRIYIIDAEVGSSLDRRTGKTNKSLPWAQEEFINLYLNE